MNTYEIVTEKIVNLLEHVAAGAKLIRVAD